MSKAKMMEAIARAQPGLGRRRLGRIVDALVDEVAQRLSDDGVFTVPGVGTLVVVSRPARRGFSPASGGFVEISARRVLRARISRVLQRRLDESQR